MDEDVEEKSRQVRSDREYARAGARPSRVASRSLDGSTVACMPWMGIRPISNSDAEQMLVISSRLSL